MASKKKTVAAPPAAPEGAELLTTVVPPEDLLQVCGLPAADGGSSVVLEIVPGDAVAAARQVDAKIQRWLSTRPEVAKVLAYHIGVTWSLGNEKAVVAVTFLRAPAPAPSES